MGKVRIIGGNRLQGQVEISGAKNAALPLMAACLLTDQSIRLSNLPHLADISTMANLLVQHGVDFKLDGCDSEDGGHFGEILLLKGNNIKNFEANYDMVCKMRASVLVLGPLLARFGTAKVSLPGGCAIGSRPINLHLDAFEKMGAKIDIDEGYIIASIDGKLQGAEIEFEKVSVGATENVIMAASIAEGKTIIKNAACEPEVSDLANCLVSMGAKIKGIGTSTLEIEGVERLEGTNYSVISDRIEAGTYMAATAITGGDVELIGIDPSIMTSTIEIFQKIGVEVTTKDNSIHVKHDDNKTLNSCNIVTNPYPDFATDMQAQFMSMLCLADGVSTITETIFENRYMHVPELCRMGASIEIDGRKATITGVEQLNGAELMATDLRASVSLVIAALAAKGETIINKMHHIDRGYERIEEKLSGIGAYIERLKA